MRLYTIDGGIESITRELSSRIHDRILLGHRVTRVEKTPAGTYKVHARTQRQPFREEFDVVVVALPNNWIPAIDWGGGSLAGAMHAHHSYYDYPAHYLRVSLLFERPFWRDQIDASYFMLDAFGGCCVYDETSRYSACECGALGWLLAGEAALNSSNYSDRELIAHALQSLPSCLPGGHDLFLEGRVHRWVGSVNGWPGGHPAKDPTLRHVPDPGGNPDLFVVGDYLFDSTLNGVLDSADTVAELILELQTTLDEPVLLTAAAHA